MRAMRLASFRWLLLVSALIAAAPTGAGAALRSDRFLAPLPQRMHFDLELGVHTLPELEGVYFFDRAFLRLRNGSWQFSRSAVGPWRERPVEWVPLRLRLKHFFDER